jgi:Asp-tRNA(Asn)/Glu-tRNA(Gln) amidotransferase A subunit family amidase
MIEADRIIRESPHDARLEAAIRPGYLALTSPENLAGFPALALPVPTGQQLPASLQLIGGPNAEALLLATGIGLSGGLPGRLTCRASEPGGR